MSDNSFVTKNGLIVSANNTLTANSITGRVGVNTASPSTSFYIAANDAIQIPSGTSAQRGPTANGMFRYNTDLNAFEGSANNSWLIIAQAGANNSIFSTITAGTIQFNTNGTDYILGASNSYSIFLSNTKVFGISSSSANLFANSIYFTPGQISIGANTIISNNSMIVGNSTIFTSQNSTGVTITGTSNTITIAAPTTTQRAGNYYLNANGSYTIVDQTASVGSNTYIEFNDSGIRAGASFFTYDKTNKLVINWAGLKSRFYDPTNNASSFAEIFNDGSMHIEANTNLWINYNTGQNIYLSGNTGTVIVAGGSGLTVANGDIRTNRPGTAGNTGAIFLGNTGNRYLFYSGSGYTMPGADLFVNGSLVLTTSTYNSYAPTLTGTGASGNWGINVTGSAGTLNGYTINQNLNTTSNVTFNNVVSTYSTINQLVTNSNSPSVAQGNINTSLLINTSNTTTAPTIGFNRTGAYAAFLGLDTDNQFKVGGWSMGNTSYPLLHSSNFNTYAPTLTGTGASGTWNISVSGTSAVATTVNAGGSVANSYGDLTRHINLFGGVYGMSITGNALNYVIPSTATHYFYSGGNITFTTNTTSITANANITVAGSISATSLAGGAATGTGASGTWGINVTGYQSTTSLGKTGNQPVTGANTWTVTDWSNLPIGYTSFLSNATNNMPLAQYMYFMKFSNRENFGGFGGVSIDWANNDLYVCTLANTATTIKWTKQLSNTNFNSYAPTLTGVGASGNWAINANTATTAVSAQTATNALRVYSSANASLTAMAFTWAGQAGQPGWVWGGNDGITHYAYNPANFNVNNAVSAQTATNALKIYNNANASTTAMTFSYTGSAGQPAWVWGGNDGITHYVWNPTNFNVNNAVTVNGYNVNQNLRTTDNVAFSALSANGSMGSWTTSGWTLPLAMSQASCIKWRKNASTSYDMGLGCSSDTFYLFKGPTGDANTGNPQYMMILTDTYADIAGARAITVANFPSYFSMRRVGYGASTNTAAGGWSNGAAAGPAGTFITGIVIYTDYSHLAYYQYLQWYWNGTYYTIN